MRLVKEEPELLKRITFYIIPRLNPDGAEFAVTTQGRVRSRIDKSIRLTNNLYQQDIDGNGMILSMRREHPDGSLIKDPKDDRLMIRRKFNSKGPFYKVYPEGIIHNWDGSENIKIGGRSFDWNRNWSYDWRPEPEQSGSGDFPFSELEMKCIAEFIHSRKNIFGILGYHTGPEAVLRPPSTGSDSDINEEDLIMMEELAQIGSKETGFPVIPVIKYHKVNRRDNNLRGHFHNFGYHHLGLFVFEFELGVLTNSAGISTEEQFKAVKEEDIVDISRKLAKWIDTQKNKEEFFVNWERFVHPQLGEVEIGGLRSTYVGNPSLSKLEEISKRTYSFTLKHSEMHPNVLIEEIKTESVGDGVYRIRAAVRNKGALPTNITNKGKSLKRLQTVQVEFVLSEKSKLLSLNSFYDLGHLPGISGNKVEWFVSSKDKRLGSILLKAGTGGNQKYEITV